MFGASAKADKGAVKISTNIFAALDTRKKRSTKKETEKPVKEPAVQKEAKKPASVWTAQQVTVSSWADCEEDDDDYFATTAPLQTWGNAEAKVTEIPVTYDEKVHEESEAEEEVEDEIDEDVDEEPEAEKDEPPQTKTETVAKLQNPPPKETERVLSKKELKMKELAELDAVLAELGLANPKDKAAEEKPSGDSEPPNGTLTKSKSKKKKTKKDKTSEAEAASETNGELLKPETDSTSQLTKEEVSVKEDSAPVDPRERLKKLASKSKKDKGTSDAAKKAAAAEAATRAAKAAALSKKKEKTHYNQAATR